MARAQHRRDWQLRAVAIGLLHRDMGYLLTIFIRPGANQLDLGDDLATVVLGQEDVDADQGQAASCFLCS